MTGNIIAGLAHRLAGWLDEAERGTRPAARRAARDGRASLDELRDLWTRIEDLVERDVAPKAARYAGEAGAAAADYARTGSRAAADYAGRGGRMASRYAGQAGEAAADYATWAGERAYDGIRDAVDRYGPRAREIAGDAWTQARDAARARPVTAIALAVAGTWLVTSLLRARR